MEDIKNTTLEEIVCYEPSMITTDGIWSGQNPLNYALPLFLLQVVLVVTATRICEFILKPIRQPRVISEILGGVILGPSVLGRSKTFADAVFPLRSVMVIETMANVGLIYFLFLLGVGMDASALRRIGKKSVTIAVAGMILPFSIGAIFSFFLIGDHKGGTTKGSYIILLGVVLSVTALPVLARILVELKLINTEMGRVALSSALVTDVCSWALLAVSIALAANEKPSLASLMVLLSSALFVAVYAFAVRPALMWIVRNTPEGQSFSDFYICLILAGVMISGFITDSFGTHSVFGAFVFGLTIPNGPLGLALVEKLEDFISGLLLPLFFAISGLKTNLGLINRLFTWAILIILVVLACIGKIVGTVIVALSYQMSLSEGAALGLLMNTKGLVEIVVLNVGRDQKVLDEESFATMVIITVLMTGIIVPGISALYKPSRGFISYKRRTIQMSKRDAEFRVLVCVHTPRNVSTIINLIEASNPTKKSPICIYLLHLVELTGRASALLIVHSSRKPADPPALNRNQAQSEHIISAFENYEQHADNVSVQPLTAVSPHSTMHEDICNLAVDKRVAFIIIPFHKQQTVDGGMETANLAIRTVNQNVLAKAPCSVGILVDRGLNGSNRIAADQLSNHVAVLFFGGPDDREALSYGWRMSEHPGVTLTIMRFVPGKEVTRPVLQPSTVNPDEPRILNVETDQDTEKQLDEKLVNMLMMGHEYDDSIVYIEKVVNNGEETMAAIRSTNDVHDLFIVGRGQGMISPLTAGLTDWSECPELGAIGDLLASSDFVATGSVLVVQQYVGAGSEEDELGTPDNSGMTNEEYVNQMSHHSTPSRGHTVFNTDHL
ncbi:cation/H(+) antiporter 15-like [Gastrolobium bilobum]|uniref:cation/H(+) antiporter 15-like n=1 Tax=Gastrolobium bilobum TaxID=150636 RepID=UPI002AB003FB|nr:cation/H(+) antiporter 15-like [Gastrolobium bilobum]